MWSATRWGARILVCAIVMLDAVGCSDDGVPLPSAAESSTGEPSPGSTTASDPSSTSITSGTTTGTTIGLADDTTSTASTGEPEVIFLPAPDFGEGDQCNIFIQNCPPDQKCTPWATDGGSSWNAWGCKPLADDPVGIDESCHVEGSYYSGIDDCERGAMCWDVDPKTNQGVCIPLCSGVENTPLCEDPQRRCKADGDSILWLCVPICDPIAQDCPAGAACLPEHIESDAEWGCTPDASGAMGVYGDPCEFTNLCDPGLICLDASTVPAGQACEGANGCCTEVCDLADPLGDLQCAGAAGGQVCLPWYEDGEAPPGYEPVGVCTLP